MKIGILIVPVSPTAPMSYETDDGTHASLCARIDDVNTDTVFFADGSGMLKVPANGKASEKYAPNPRATQVMEHFLPGFAKRDHVVGTAVFVGLDANGDICDVPESVTGFVTAMFGPVASTSGR